ncbi:hypothetical protein NXF25_018787, partial [Crotalus adamanteus]
SIKLSSRPFKIHPPPPSHPKPFFLRSKMEKSSSLEMNSPPQPDQRLPGGFAPRISETMPKLLVNTMAGTAQMVQVSVEAQKSAQILSQPPMPYSEFCTIIRQTENDQTLQMMVFREGFLISSSLNPVVSAKRMTMGQMKRRINQWRFETKIPHTTKK